MREVNLEELALPNLIADYKPQHLHLLPLFVVHNKKLTMMQMLEPDEASIGKDAGNKEEDAQG